MRGTKTIGGSLLPLYMVNLSLTCYANIYHQLAQHILLLHGKVKKLCEGIVHRMYGLIIGDLVKVTWLLQGIAYTFPNDYKVQSYCVTACTCCRQFNMALPRHDLSFVTSCSAFLSSKTCSRPHSLASGQVMVTTSHICLYPPSLTSLMRRKYLLPCWHLCLQQ